MKMKIVGIGLSKNEADVIEETVTAALRWVDDYILYDSSTDSTADLARKAGATVITGDPQEDFDESLRQHTLDAARNLAPDWLVRIDADEIYPLDQNPRQVLAGYAARGTTWLRAHVIEFWLTLDDLWRGALLEDPAASVRQRRRWYSVGGTAVVAWKERPDLRYYPGQPNNVPLDAERRDVAQLGPGTCALRQLHYPCRSVGQIVQRVADRRRNLRAFGKYKHNLIIDEQVAGLHYWTPGESLDMTANRDGLYHWYEVADQLYAERTERYV